VADLRLDCITTSVADTLELPGTGSNQNCALRTLRRMLSLAHEYGILRPHPVSNSARKISGQPYGMLTLKKPCSSWLRSP
jgi:hypothetical protein